MKTQTILMADIATIKASQATLNELIQDCCINVIGHAMLYGDVTLGDRLLDATKGSDRKAIVTYLKEFGPFRVDAETGTFKLNKKFRDEHEFNEEELADGVKWYSFAPDKKTVMAAFDVRRKVLALVKQTQTKASEGTEVENAELLAYIESAVKQYNKDVADAKRALFEGKVVVAENDVAQAA